MTGAGRARGLSPPPQPPAMSGGTSSTAAATARAILRNYRPPGTDASPGRSRPCLPARDSATRGASAGVRALPARR
ncbi:hypothetical protein GCM10009527_009430 [Actinomadura nitritigenes]